MHVEICPCPPCPPHPLIIKVCDVRPGAGADEIILTLCVFDANTNLPLPAGFTYAWVVNLPFVIVADGIIEVTVSPITPTLVATVTVTHPTLLYCTYSYTFINNCPDVDLTFECELDCETKRVRLVACVNGNCNFDPSFIYIWYLPGATGIVNGAFPNEIFLDATQILLNCSDIYTISVFRRADGCKTTTFIERNFCDIITGDRCDKPVIEAFCLHLICPALIPLRIVIPPTNNSGGCYRLTVGGVIIGTFFTSMTFTVPQGATVKIDKQCDPTNGHWEAFTDTGATTATTTTFAMPASFTFVTLNFFYAFRQLCLDQNGNPLILPSPPYCPPNTVGTPVGELVYKYWKQINDPTPQTANSTLYTGSIAGLIIAATYAQAICIVQSTCLPAIRGLRINSQNRNYANNIFDVNASGVFFKDLQSVNYDPNKEFTIEMWLYVVKNPAQLPPGNLTDNCIIAKQQGIHDGWMFRIVESGLYGGEALFGNAIKGFAFSFLQGDTLDPTSFAITYMPVTLPTKTWCHVVLVRRQDIPNNRTKLEIYYNGVRNDNGTQAFSSPGVFTPSLLPAVTIVSKTANLAVGCDSPVFPLPNPPVGMVNGSLGGGMNSDIVIGDVKIYQIAVNPTIPTAMFTNGFLLGNKNFSPFANLKFHSNFDELTGLIAVDSVGGNNGNLSGYNGDTEPLTLTYGIVPGTYTYTEDTTLPFNATIPTGNPPFGNLDNVPPHLLI